MPQGPAETLDAAIVGGGVIGLAVAFELARRGRTVALIERGAVGGGATRAAGGMLAPVSEADVLEPELIAFGLDSLQRYPGFVREVERSGGLPCRHERCGALWVATDRDDQEELERLHQTLALKELPSEPWTPRRVLEHEPHLSQRILGGLHVARDEQIDPRALALALAAALRARNVDLRPGTTVESVESVGASAGASGAGAGEHAVVIRDPQGARSTLRCRQLVWAAGAWTDAGLPEAVAKLGVRPVKGQLVRLRGPRLLQRLIRTPEVYLIPRADGELLIGGTTEEAGFDTQPTGGAVMDLLRHAWRVLPGVYDLEFAEVSVGLRPALDDHLPAIGALGSDGLFCAVGHYRHGVLLAPATAHYLAEWMESGVAPAALRPFVPMRVDRDRGVA